jgi:hypothetical protein
VSSFSYVGRSFGDGSYTESTLQPHFEREFKGHTLEFREEVEALARKDNHLKRQPRSLEGRVSQELRTDQKYQSIIPHNLIRLHTTLSTPHTLPSPSPTNLRKPLPLESATFISDLVTSNPAHTDGLSQADSHMEAQ